MSKAGIKAGRVAGLNPAGGDPDVGGREGSTPEELANDLEARLKKIRHPKTW